MYNFKSQSLKGSHFPDLTLLVPPQKAVEGPPADDQKTPAGTKEGEKSEQKKDKPRSGSDDFFLFYNKDVCNKVKTHSLSQIQIPTFHSIFSL